VKAKTLMLYKAEKALDLLGDVVGFFREDMEGTAWLPLVPLGLEDPGVAEVTQQGLGEMVEAYFYYDARELAEALDPLYETGDWASFKLAVATHPKVAHWAHYGVYGDPNETWVIIFKGSASCQGS